MKSGIKGNIVILNISFCVIASRFAVKKYTFNKNDKSYCNHNTYNRMSRILLGAC